MKKSILLALLLVASLSLVVVAKYGYASDGTQVGGVMTADTTWTQAGSPYNLTSPGVVSYGVTLTIQPGVTVNLNGYNLQVNGVLTARGDQADYLNFDSIGSGDIAFSPSSTGWNEQTSTGSIIEYANLNNASIVVSDIAPEIEHNIINVGSGFGCGAINLENAAAVISDNTIYGDIQCIDSASPTITGNFIQGQIYGQGLDLSAPIIVDNVIEGGTNQVIENAGIYDDGANFYIANNTIFNCGNGIVLDDGAQEVTGNLIINNTDAISISGSSVSTSITHNTIYNNTAEFSVYDFSGVSTIAYNNIVDNKQYSLTVGNSPGSLAYNWWGTTSSSVIAQMLPSGATYTPFLTAPDQQAPAIPNDLPTGPFPSPSPTPSPSLTPFPTPSPTPSQTQQPQNTVSQSPSPISSPSPSPNPTATSNPTNTPTTTAYAPSTAVPELSSLAALSFLALSLAGLAVTTLKKKQLKNSKKQS